MVYLSYPGPTTVGLAYAEGWPPFGLAWALYQVPTPLAEELIIADCISTNYNYLQVITDMETELRQMYMHCLSDDAFRSKMTSLE